MWALPITEMKFNCPIYLNNFKEIARNKIQVLSNLLRYRSSPKRM